jgi:dTDP-4-dehydrorhamnose reductase
VDGLRAGREIPVLTDRVVSPSYSPDVAAATRHLLEGGAPSGVYHAVNAGHTTWEQFALHIAGLLGVTPNLKRLTMDQLTLRAARPRYCALASPRLAAQGFTMPSWQDAVRRWLGLA